MITTDRDRIKCADAIKPLPRPCAFARRLFSWKRAVAVIVPTWPLACV